MMMRRALAKAGKAVVGPFVAIALIVYFSFNLVGGDHGLKAWVHRERQMKVARAELHATAARLAALRHRANLLKGDHLDRDLLDQQARSALNEIGPDEIVIFKADGETPAASR
ncbi:MAG: FtsB family cell division protein [Stellaceae bacterium]